MFSFAIQLVVVLVVGTHSITAPRALEITDSVTKYYADYGVGLNLRRVIKMRDPWSGARRGYLSATRELRGWQIVLKRKGLLKRGSIVHVLTPYYTYQGNRYISGAANRVCSYPHSNAFSFSVAEEDNGRGEARVLHCQTAMAHEIGHLLCLPHQRSGLMLTDAMAEVRDSIPPLDATSAAILERLYGSW